MRGILLNMLFITLTGSIILAVRKMWGETLHPWVLKGFWVLFFICALCPMSSADRLGRAVIQWGGEQEASVKYEWRSEWHYGAYNTLPVDSMNNMDGYRLWKRLKELSLTVWGAGCILSLLYKMIGAGMLYYKSRADCKYKLEPEKLREMGISLSVPVQITENTGPMVLGIIALGIRPAIYVPERFLLEDEKLFKSIVLHEKEHIARKHHLILVLMNLTGSIYWFLPYVERIFFRALREDMEYRCDYELIRNHAVEIGEYAKHCIAVAKDRGRLCNELPFGEGGLKKRVRYMRQNGKKRMASLLTGAAIGITVLICITGIALYYKRDVNGFTRWEVEEAKEVLVNYVDATNSGNEENINAWVAENSRLRHTIDRTEGGNAVYDITYEPEDWTYYYVIKNMDQDGLDKSNYIFLMTNFELHGRLYRGWFFELVREDKNSTWKIYNYGVL